MSRPVLCLLCSLLCCLATTLPAQARAVNIATVRAESVVRSAVEDSAHPFIVFGGNVQNVAVR